jgi:hypothetical protein
MLALYNPFGVRRLSFHLASGLPIKSSPFGVAS